MNNFISTFLLLIITLALSACGGGSGGESESSQSFSLSMFQSTTEGPIYNAQLTGSDSFESTYTGSISVANGSQVTLDGVLVTPRNVIISLLPTVGSSITVSSTSYTDAGGYTVSVEVQTEDISCIPATPYRLPDSVTIGDLDILSTLSCDGGITEEMNWRVEDAGNGRARIITSATVKNQLNEIVSTADVTYTVDNSGNIVKFKSVTTTFDEDSYTLTYESI